MPVRRGCGNSGRTFEDLAKAFSVAANVDPMRRRSFSPSSFFREYFAILAEAVSANPRAGLGSLPIPDGARPGSNDRSFRRHAWQK